MNSTLTISPAPSGLSVLGTRYEALRLRSRLESLLVGEGPVTVDFGGMFVTQSFADELLGPIALRIGPQLLEKVIFSGCIEDTKDVLRLVLSGRLKDYAAHQSAAASRI